LANEVGMGELGQILKQGGIGKVGWDIERSGFGL
jgi:hypothetical protein